MALDFPASPSVGDTYTSSGITYTWDGDTWKALGAGATVGATTLGSLTDVNLSSPAPVTNNSLVYNGTNWFPSNPVVSSINAVGDVDTISSAPSIGQALIWDGSNWVPGTVNTGLTGLQSRTTAQATTASIADGVADNITIAVAKTYVLHKIEVDAGAWVTLYTDAASRTADATRTELEDPATGSGVLAEVITSTAATTLMTPGTFGFNNDSTPSTNVYLQVVNKSGSTQAITVTLTFVALEV